MRRRLWAAAATAALSFGVGALPVGAAETVAVGWWTRSPSQEAPEGGFAAAAAPDGTVTVSAVLVDLGREGVSLATLRAVETGGLGQAGASLQVCPTDDPWQPVSGGDLTDAPSPACDGSGVAFERDEESASWEADVTGMLDGRTGTATLMVVPGPAAEGQVASPLFDVRFAAPEFEALEQTSDDGGFSFDERASDNDDESTGSGDTTGSGPETSPAVRDVGSSPNAASPPTSARAVTPEPEAIPDPEGGGSEPLEPEETTSLAQDQAPAEDDGAQNQTMLRAAGSSTGASAPWGQALFFVLLSAAAGMAAAFGNRWLRQRETA